MKALHSGHHRLSPLLPLAMLLFAATSLAQPSASTSSSASPFLGKWDITGEGRYGNYVYWLEIGRASCRERV